MLKNQKIVFYFCKQSRMLWSNFQLKKSVLWKETNAIFWKWRLGAQPIGYCEEGTHTHSE
jgi:hypothetical protein